MSANLFFYRCDEEKEEEPLKYLFSVLKLSSLWSIRIGWHFAIQRLLSCEDFDPSLKLCLASMYDIDKWVDPAFCKLVSKNFNNLTDRDTEYMGTSTFRILMRTSLWIKFMCLCVAYTSPEIIHCKDYMDNELCQKAWDSKWWRGFCRHLLHPDKIMNPIAAVILLENVKIKKCAAAASPPR